MVLTFSPFTPLNEHYPNYPNILIPMIETIHTSLSNPKPKNSLELCPTHIPTDISLKLPIHLVPSMLTTWSFIHHSNLDTLLFVDPTPRLLFGVSIDMASVKLG